ncbi:MAG: hypothetical protein IJT12_07690 [Paludibacteraceae bacterium]|nr:hypothetical protein [Paludibacteraceae bacterium]
MQIIAHRGFWKTQAEKNSRVALERAIKCGYGFETDFRDYGGKVLISHNPPMGDELTADESFRMYAESGRKGTLALNIKADGLQDMMHELLEKYGITDYFLFDMSVCDTIPYIERKMKIASRSSEFEPYLPFYKDSKVVWVDYFDGRTNIADELRKYIADGKTPSIVSPELHGLPYEPMWQMLHEQIANGKIVNDIMLCTDVPDKAEQYFNR